MCQLISVNFQSMATSNQSKEMEERMIKKTMATGSEVRAVKTLQLGTKGSGNTNGLEKKHGDRPRTESGGKNV